MNLLNLELKRAIFNKGLLFAIVFGIVLCGIGVYPNIDPTSYSSYEAWFFGIGRGTSFFILFIPILVAIPYSTMLVTERKYGYLKYVYVRDNKRNYLITKGIATSLVGGLALVIPALFLFLTLKTIMPNTLNTDGFYPKDPLAFIYTENPDLYILLYCAWIFFQGIIWSLFSFCISLLVRKPFLAIAIPFLYYMLANFAFDILGVGRFTPPASFAPYLMGHSNWFSIFSQPIILLLASIVLIMFYNLSKENLYD